MGKYHYCPDCAAVGATGVVTVCEEYRKSLAEKSADCYFVLRSVGIRLIVQGADRESRAKLRV